MEKIFLKVLNMSATASIVILAVLLMRLLLRKAPKKYSYWLWSVVGFRLCCPVSISSALSLLNFVPSAPSRAAGRGTVMQFIPDDIALAPQPRVELITPRLSEAINNSLPAATPQYSANPMQIWLFIGAVLWCIGMAALLVYSIVSVWRLRRRIATATRLEGNVWQSENVSSPFILGVFAPRIYLPYHLGEQERDYVLAHENYHLKRHDYLVKLFAFALLTVHWFNPLCYLAFVLMTRDMEMSCDEAVLAKSDGIKTAYSTTLLSFAANRRFPSAIPLAFGESGVGSRIKNVLSWKAPKRYVAPVAFLLCAAIVLVCAMNPRQTLDEVCGDFWDNAAVCTYTEEQLSGPNVQYHPEKPLRLCDFLSGVRIGTAHAEKKVAMNPDWSTLYLALPSADDTDARHLTIDFVREHDTLVSPEAIYSLNIGTRDDSKSYKVLSGQEEIDAFLAYLRGETPDSAGFIEWCGRFRSENVTNLSISVDGAAALGYTGETLKSMASELEPRLRALTAWQQVQLPDADALDDAICLMIGDNKDDYMINLSADGNYANTLHVLGAFRADEEGKYFRSEAYYDAPWIASWIRAKAIPLLEGDLPEAVLPLEEETREIDGVSQTVKSILGEFPGGTRFTVGTFKLPKGTVTFSGAWSPSYASVCAIVKPNNGGGDGAVIYFKPGESVSLDFGQSGSYDIVLLAPREGIDGTMQIAMP